MPAAGGDGTGMTDPLPGTAPLSIALLHHPVLNRHGQTVGSAVTNLDLHDISRAARTYGVQRFFVATPYDDQHELIADIVAHWRNGHGARANPTRTEALSIIRPARDLAEITARVAAAHEQPAFVVATSARRHVPDIGFAELRRRLETEPGPVLILFGTAYGLAPAAMQAADAVLAPIAGRTDYNHLSVRSAAAIVLDRLLGDGSDTDSETSNKHAMPTGERS